jgi:hypothetical protein
MTRLRIRSEAAWTLRRIAGWLNRIAARWQPVKLNVPVRDVVDSRAALRHPRYIAQVCVDHGVIQQHEVPAFTKYLASKDVAAQAIEKARH